MSGNLERSRSGQRANSRDRGEEVPERRRAESGRGSYRGTGRLAHKERPSERHTSPPNREGGSSSSESGNRPRHRGNSRQGTSGHSSRTSYGAKDIGVARTGISASLLARLNEKVAQ